MMKLVDFQLSEGNSATDPFGASYDCLALPLQYGDEVFVALQTVVGGGGFNYFADVIGPGNGGGLGGPWGAAGTFGRPFDEGLGGSPSGVVGIARKRIEGPGPVDDLTADGTGTLSRVGFHFPTGASSDIFGGAWATWVFRGDGAYTKAGKDSGGIARGDGAAIIDGTQAMECELGAVLKAHQAVIGMGFGEVYNNYLDAPSVERPIFVSDDLGYLDILASTVWTNSFDGRHESVGHCAVFGKGKGLDATHVTFTAEELGFEAATDNWITGAFSVILNFTTPLDTVGTDSWTFL
jgi:hypothetical protein